MSHFSSHFRKNLEYKYGAEYGFGSNNLAAVVGVKDKDNLTGITIPNKVFKGLRFYEVCIIASNAFEDCHNLKNVTISNRNRKNRRIWFC